MAINTAAPIEELREARLRRMKAIALGLLLGAIALLALAHWYGRVGVWGWIGAFAEAATIGALADWFAVVALFRHPLGVPIPHTAIIPRNKARIADALATFVADNFLAREQILRKLHDWNPALRLGDFLSTPARLEQLAKQLQAWLAHALGALDEPAFERELMAVVRRQLTQWNAAATGAQLMRALTHGDHHQRLLNAALEQMARWLNRAPVRQAITDKLVEMARREFPKVLWLTDTFGYTEELGDALSARLANALLDEVQAILNTPDHPLRQHYAKQAVLLMENLENDAQLQEKVADFKQRLLDSPELNNYVRQLWLRLRAWLHADLARADSTSMGQFRQYATRLGKRLQSDPLWQDAANAQLRIAAEHIAGQLRVVAPHYIRQTVESWDTQFLVEEIERSAGRDLQFIRVNGTLIGGLAGVALYALFQLPIWH